MNSTQPCQVSLSFSCRFILLWYDENILELSVAILAGHKDDDQRCASRQCRVEHLFGMDRLITHRLIVSSRIAAWERRGWTSHLLPDDLYVHLDAVEKLEPLLRVHEGCGRTYLGEAEGRTSSDALECGDLRRFCFLLLRPAAWKKRKESGGKRRIPNHVRRRKNKKESGGKRRTPKHARRHFFVLHYEPVIWRRLPDRWLLTVVHASTTFSTAKRTGTRRRRTRKSTCSLPRWAVRGRRERRSR
jgi:hypothetical protein